MVSECHFFEPIHLPLRHECWATLVAMLRPMHHVNQNKKGIILNLDEFSVFGLFSSEPIRLGVSCTWYI